VTALALVSTPGPIVRLNDNADFYLRFPRVALPVFAVRSAMRLLPEAMSARLKWGSRIQFLAEHGARVVASPLSPTQMVHWVRAWQQTDITKAARRVTAPTLVLTGEASLDKVVPVSSTLEYLDLIPGSRYEVLQRTGHVGLVSRPEDFAKVIGAFSEAHDVRPAVAAPAIARAAGQAG
jgi:pimeloyl-ACP methyl ester carboxylesterase